MRVALAFLRLRERMTEEAYAEKSAEAVAASVASEERRACQHAPLWPMKVPILCCISSAGSQADQE